jgi:hypothetical protein
MRGFDILFALIPIAVLALALVPIILALVDIMKRSFSNDIEKILWVLIVLLFNPFGAIIYYFMVVKKPK